MKRRHSLCLKAAVEKFLTKERGLQKLICKIVVLYLCCELVSQGFRPETGIKISFHQN